MGLVRRAEEGRSRDTCLSLLATKKVVKSNLTKEVGLSIDTFLFYQLSKPVTFPSDPFSKSLAHIATKKVVRSDSTFLSKTSLF